jgi:hypothetical protein
MILVSLIKAMQQKNGKAYKKIYTFEVLKP